eukprot:5108041-Amphidinium_carterae.1
MCVSLFGSNQKLGVVTAQAMFSHSARPIALALPVSYDSSLVMNMDFVTWQDPFDSPDPPLPPHTCQLLVRLLQSEKSEATLPAQLVKIQLT